MRSYELWKKAFFFPLILDITANVRTFGKLGIYSFLSKLHFEQLVKEGHILGRIGLFFFFKEKLLKRELHEWEQVCNYCMRGLK